MRKLFLAFSSLALAATGLVSSVQAQSGPKVVQRSVILNVNEIGRYWPDPKKEPVYNKAAWIPYHLYLNFQVVGPLAPGSMLSMEFLKPDGKPWVSTNCQTPELDEGAVEEIKCDSIDETKAIPMTGNFGVKIRLKNELEDINTELFKGRMKVITYNDKYNKKPQHAVNEDWRVPLAYVSIDKAYDEERPIVISHFWFKHRDLNSNDLTAYLFYNGKQVAISTDGSTTAQNVIDRDANLEPADPKQDYSYQLWKFIFMNARGYAHNTENFSSENWHVLDQNPGNYEIKVLHKGKLVRTASFSVGPDGQIVVPGSVEKDTAGNDRILIPTKVSGAVDVAWDKAAYKTEVYYGNPGPATSGVLAP